MQEGLGPRWKVGLADFRLAGEPSVLVAYGLGSCVGVSLFDPTRRICALAHIMLPFWGNGPGDDNPRKYADRALEMMVEALLRAGASRAALGGKMAGGATMFPEIQRAPVGERNVQAVGVTLAALGIPLLGQDVGGDYGRTVELYSDAGRLLVRSYRKGDLWI
jgi:chemotaxis protein CheD